MRKFLDLLRMPGATSLILSSFPGRLSYGMLAMSLYWKAYDSSHSFAFAGLVLACNSIAGACTSGPRASLIDRIGLRLPLRIFAPCYAIGIIGFNYVSDHVAMLVVATLFGLLAPPINLSVRPLWRAIIPKENLRIAYALDVTVMSTSAILGPSIATILAASKHPSIALNVTGALMFIGGTCLGSLQVAKDWKPVHNKNQKVKLFALPAMKILIAEGIVIGLGNGATIVGFPSLAIADHVKYLSGWLLSVIGISNVIGSLIAGNISKHVTPLQAFLRNYLLWSLITIPICFLNFNIALFILGATLGMIGGAQMVFYIELSDAVRPMGVATALLGWLWTFEGTAQGLGQGLGGFLSQKVSVHMPFIFDALAVFAGLNLIYFNRRHLVKGNRSMSEIEAEKAIYEEAMENSN